MSRPAARIPMLELALAIVSALTILALLAYLALLGWRGQSPSPPEITVSLGAAQPLATGWLVPFEVANTGDQPVSQLTVELTAAEQRGETVIDFLAAHSSVRGGFFLTDDPGTAQLQGRALGFVEP